MGYPGLLFLARLKPSKLRNVRRHAARMRSRAKLVPSALHYNYSVPPLLKTPNFGMPDLSAHLS